MPTPAPRARRAIIPAPPHQGPTMHLRFSPRPGRWERHLQRRHLNPMFGGAAATRGELDRARARDRQEEADLRERLGAAGRERAARLFDPETHRRKMLEIYAGI